MLIVESTAIEDVKAITSETFADKRGTFCESYNRTRYFKNGIELDFVQDNLSSSVDAGTVRGLHFQRHPTAQAKLVRVVRGSVLDIAVDLRRSSRTYGKWVAETLSADNGKQLLVPVGFAHGFCTLEPNTHVLYKVTSYYSPVDDFGIAWDDPDLAIDWPVGSDKVMLSDKDRCLPKFKSLPAYFD